MSQISLEDDPKRVRDIPISQNDSGSCLPCPSFFIVGRAQCVVLMDLTVWRGGNEDWA